MAFDALTLSAVRDELEPLLVGARMQKLVLLDELSLAIEAFSPEAGRTNVLLSAHLEHGRVQRIPHLPPRGLERDTPFSLVARKYLRNARITSVRQPRLERVLEIVCEQKDASGELQRVLLIVEAMGRRSNLVLVDDHGTILDAARRSPPSRNPRRPVLPHLPYVAPPPQDRLLPEQLSTETLAEGAAGRSGSLAKYLADRIAGLSPLTGRELAFQAVGAAEAPLTTVDWHRVLIVIHAFLEPLVSHAWQPTVALVDGRPLDYAPYDLSHLAAAGAHVDRLGSISEAISAYYTILAETGPATRGDALRAERRSLFVPLDRAISSGARRIAALEHQLRSGRDQQDPLRRAGEAILAHQAELTRGATELKVGDELFELDPLLTPVENAQAYFARYRRAREAEQRVPELLEHARNTGTHLADLRAMVELADDMDAIRALRREVGAATGGSTSKTDGTAQRTGGPARHKQRGRDTPGQAKTGPHRRVSVGDGWEVLIGTTAAGNAAVTFDLAQPDDLWLHARGVPGAHVILRTRGSSPPDAIVERAAQVAAWHSAARAAGAVEVDIAQRRHVRKIPNAPPGLVRYTDERTVRVTPSSP